MIRDLYIDLLEASDAFELDRNPNVHSWVKNEHLGFEVLFIFKGVVQKFRPDFIIRLKTGDFLVSKQRDRKSNRTKQNANF